MLVLFLFHILASPIHCLNIPPLKMLVDLADEFAAISIGIIIPVKYHKIKLANLKKNNLHHFTYIIDPWTMRYDAAVNNSGSMADKANAFPDLIVVPDFENADNFTEQAFAVRDPHDLNTWVIGVKDSENAMKVSSKLHRLYIA